MDINSTRARLAIILACGLIPAALLTFRDRPIEAGGIRIPTVRSALGDIGVLPTLEPLAPLEVAGATPVPSGSLDPSGAEGAVADAGSSGPAATPAPREAVPLGPVPREPDAGVPPDPTTSGGATPVPGSGTPGANPTPGATPVPGASPTPTPAPLPGSSPTPGATPGPTPAPLPDPTPQPTPEPTPAPVPDPTPQPTPEPTPAPTPDPTPEPTVDILPTLEPLPTLPPPPTLEPVL